MSAQLYYTPTSCGAASYIAAKKANTLGKSVHANLVDIGSHIIKSGPLVGKSFYDVNPKGNVGTLIMPDGTLLNENAVILQYIADTADGISIAPADGTSARYAMQCKLSWISSELHASIGPLFNQSLSPEVRAFHVAKVKTKLDFLETKELVGGKKFLFEDSFSIADCLTYVMYKRLTQSFVDSKPYWRSRPMAQLKGLL
jgi:glutathione S-transferase